MKNILDYFDFEMSADTEHIISLESKLEWKDFVENGFDDITPNSSAEEIFKTAYYLGFRSALMDVLCKETEVKP